MSDKQDIIVKHIIEDFEHKDISLYSAIHNSYEEGYLEGEYDGFRIKRLPNRLDRFLCKLGIHNWRIYSSCAYGYSEKCLDCQQTRHYNCIC